MQVVAEKANRKEKLQFMEGKAHSPIASSFEDTINKFVIGLRKNCKFYLLNVFESFERFGMENPLK